MTKVKTKIDSLTSVIIPTYKRSPETWRNAVDSVLSQTYKNIEIIMVDDNTPESKYREENTKYIKNHYFDKVTYIKNERNLGGSLARNKGIAAASGNYITFLDDDDEFIDYKIEKQLDFMIKNNYDASFSNLLIFFNNKLVDIRKFNRIKDFNNDSLLRYHVTNQITGTPSFMLKTDIVKQVNGFDEALMGQEFFLMLKIINSSAKIGYFNEYTVKVNRSEDSISFNNSKIDGEQKIFETKCSYSDKLNKREYAYIKFRHFVICAVAYYRLKEYRKVIPNLIKALLCSPLAAFGEILKSLFKKILILSERRKSG